MKNSAKFVKKMIARLTLCFTALVMTFTVVGAFADVSASGKGLAIGQLSSFFWFSCLIALSFCICDFIGSNAVLRRTLQFLLSYASVVVVFFLGDYFKSYLSGMQNPAFSILAISFMFVIIYTVIAVAVLVFNFVVSKFARNNKEYESMFNGTKNVE